MSRISKTNISFGTSSFTLKLLCLTISLLATGAVQTVQAEERPELEEVIVTAQKREQSAQDVPATVTAVQGETLNELKLFSFEDLEQISAGLDLRRVSGRSGTISLRGVDFNPNSAAAPAVDVYFNDTTLGANASGGVFQQLFDLGRVEVLRGPQGALQGRTSPAGAIAIHAATPIMDDDHAYVKATATSNSGINTQVMANYTLIPEVLTVRVAAAFDENNMNGVKNIVTGNESERESGAGRISLAWQASEALSVDLSYQYLDADSEFVPALQGSSALGQTAPNLRATDGKSIAIKPSITHGKYEYLSAKVRLDLESHTLTFVSGYSELSSLRDFDNALGNIKVGFDSNPLTAGLDSRIGKFRTQLNAPQQQQDSNYASSQELRLSSIDNEIWNYTVGVYYGAESGNFTARATQVQPLGAAVPVANSAIHFGREVRSPFDQTSLGVFTHNTFDVNDELSFQFALRWQDYEANRASTVHITEDVKLGGPLNFNNGDQIAAPLVSGALKSSESDAVTGSASVQYAFPETNVIAYASIGSSYRPGAVTIAAVNLGNNAAFEEEDSVSVELGLKSKLWDNRMRLNLSIFSQDYDNYIGRVSRLVVRDTATDKIKQTALTVNGDAEVQGIELDAEVLLTDELHLNVSMSYSEAEYKDGVNQPCNTAVNPAVGVFSQRCDVSGLELGNQPRFSASTSADYTVPLETNEVFIRALYKFTGRRTDVDASGGDLGGYSTTDLHVGIREPAGDWEISLFARNVFDKRTISNVQPGFITLAKAPSGYQIANIIAERQIGASFSYFF